MRHHAISGSVCVLLAILYLMALGIRAHLKRKHAIMDDFLTSDVVTDHEKHFPLPDLLTCDSFRKNREEYYAARDAGLLNRYRNYVILLEYLIDIYEYDQQHAKSYAKRFREACQDWRKSEAIFSEVIVYRSYVRGIYERLIRRIHLEETEADIIIERLDGSKMFLEVFCVMPDFPAPEKVAVNVYAVKTHKQHEKASIRQKLLRKIVKQNQLKKPRENFAVIELNDVSIAGDFAILSSLSGGYKLNLGVESGKILSSGYDWNNSVFNDPSTQFLKGIIYFSLGDYESRKFIFNPNFVQSSTPTGTQL